MSREVLFLRRNAERLQHTCRRGGQARAEGLGKSRTVTTSKSKLTSGSPIGLHSHSCTSKANLSVGLTL